MRRHLWRISTPKQGGDLQVIKLNLHPILITDYRLQFCREGVKEGEKEGYYLYIIYILYI